MAKPVVFVIGASGNIGASTIANLAGKYADKVEIRAGVRNPEKAEKLKSITGVKLVQATMGDSALHQVLVGVDVLYINTPPAENRAELTILTAEQAKKAGVKHIAVVSVTTADNTEKIFERQLHEVEDKVSKLGVPYTFLRLPMFMENYLGSKGTIVNQGALFYPVDPEKPYPAVAIEDAGAVSAAILANSSSYANKTIDVVSNYHTFNEFVTGLSAALGKEIKYVRVPYEAAKKAIMEMGMPEWQVNGLIELYRMIDSSDPVYSNKDVGTITRITGEQPTDLKKWLAKFAPAFQ